MTNTKSPMNGEVSELLAQWSKEEEDRLQRVAAKKREHLERLRAEMRAGRWKPSHQCPVCVQSVLDCVPSPCPEAARAGRWWWV